MSERGIAVSYESIRLWCIKFGSKYAKRLRRRHQGYGDTFFLDEVFVTIQCEQHYLWRAVDQVGEVVDVFLQNRRDGKAAVRFFKRLLRVSGSEPRRIVTCQYPPKHFTGGLSLTCFRILRKHEYVIVKKGGAPSESPYWAGDAEWREGTKKVRTHLRSERQTGLAAAKREQFIARHGHLYCENCGLVPPDVYEGKYADSCIEVHHARVAVADMKAGHLTKLEDLQCLCANCHRIEHKRLRCDAGS
jgi:hypothetical protein